MSERKRERPITYQEKTFGKNFFLCFLCNVGVISNLVFFLYFNRYLDALGASKAEIGFYMGVFALGSVILRPTIGAAADRYGRKYIIYAGLSVMIVATAGYFLCREVNWIVLVVRLLHGAGFGCYITGIFTVVADDAPAGRRAKVIGVFGLSGMGTFGFVPMLAEHIIDRFGFPFLFGAALLTLVISLGISRFIRARGPVKLEVAAISFVRLLYRIDLLIPAGALFFFCTGVGALVNFIAVYLGSLKISVAYFFIANSVAGAVVRLFLGHLSDVYGRRRVILPSFIAVSAALFWLGLFHLPWELLFCGLIWGTGIGFAVPAIAASIVDNVEPQDRGKGLALFTASFDFGAMAGSFVYGAVAEAIGYSHMYLVASAVILIAAMIARFLKS